MVTLTVKRSAWLSPELAYDRCNERVREVARRISKHRLHVTAFEVQSKTGEGWPHWHLIVYAPDERSLESIREQVRKAWRIVEERVECDESTGEVLAVSRVADSIGFSDVQEAKTRQGIARYCAKYLVKPWAAIPPWMGEGRRQLRKLRISRGAFDWLASAGRHKPAIGGRRAVLSPGRCSKRRPLFCRMAASANSMSLVQRVADRLVFRRAVPLAATSAALPIFEAIDARPIGSPDVPIARTRWRITPHAAAQLSAGSVREWAAAVSADRFRRIRAELSGRWRSRQAGEVDEPSPAS
jgi:hypothetical protein